jgi:hypothetical protein
MKPEELFYGPKSYMFLLYTKQCITVVPVFFDLLGSRPLRSVPDPKIEIASGAGSDAIKLTYYLTFWC